MHRATQKLEILVLISGFRRDVDVICGLLGDYTALWGDYLPTLEILVFK
jgi:hypothetical protein